MKTTRTLTPFPKLFSSVTERSRGALFTLVFCASALVYAQSPTPSPTTQVILIRPNGGEVFLAGSIDTIRWDSLMPGETAKLEYSTNGGAAWNLIRNKVTGTGSPWNVPVTPSDSCLARFTVNEAGTVTICNQAWMLKNLDVVTYRNGDTIPQVKDGDQWWRTTTGAWCWYSNDPAMGAKYGRLYNWYAVKDPRGLAPAGWHVPSDAEWKTLEMCLGMTQTEADGFGWRGTDEGRKMKEAGTVHWSGPNAGATDVYGFTALPGGYRDDTGHFHYERSFGYWWSSTKYADWSAFSRYLGNGYPGVERFGNYWDHGLSVRCVRD
jgi:uncharacterized protein (TIGR02145 family)